MSAWKRAGKRLLRSLGLQMRWLPPRYSCHQNAFTDQQVILGRGTAPLILDVGANIGQSVARYLWLFPDAVIHSFEPVPEAFARLQQATAGDRRVHLWPIALSDANGVARFHSNRMSDTSSLLPTVPDKSDDAFMGTKAVFEVATKTLDSFCTEQQLAAVSILKMDVQGGEARVLDGARALLGGQKADVILTEVWFDAPYVGAPHYTDIDTKLRAHGYQLYGLYFGAHQAMNSPIFSADAIYLNAAAVRRLDPGCVGIAPGLAAEFTALFGE